MLTKDFLAKIQTILIEDKARLERDLSDLGAKKSKSAVGGFESAYPESGGSSDDDNASEVTEYADELSITEKLEAELRDATKALDAIEKGTYGICKYCHKEIDVKRLEARPSSSTCISCKKTLTQEL